MGEVCGKYARSPGGGRIEEFKRRLGCCAASLERHLSPTLTSANSRYERLIPPLSKAREIYITLWSNNDAYLANKLTHLR